jgi:lycopene cyclase domain-containing protein
MEGMMRYQLFDLIMLTAVGVVVLGLRVRLPWRPLHIAIGTLLILTVIFDNLLVAMDTFRYHPEHISNWLVGRAPIEDCLYAIAAAILVPALWEALDRKREK